MPTKSKSKKVSKIKNINSSPINQELKPIDEHGYPIKRSKVCFKCGKEFYLTFSFAQQNYSHKHFWYYWTKEEKNKDCFICSICLRSLYAAERRKEFLEEIKNPKKRNNFRSLISYRLI